MAFQTIVAPTLRELFIQQVIDMIFSGELKPGDKLPTERALSEQMNISRTMVHTGIEDLSRMGFLKIEPRKGVYVADYSKTGNFETIGAIVRFSGKYNLELEYSIVELRNCIVGMAMRSLAKKIHQAGYRGLKIA